MQQGKACGICEKTQSYFTQFKENKKLWCLLSGTLSGYVEVCTTHPIDVIKTRMQTDNVHLVPTIKTVWKEQSFYRGFVPRILGIGPMRMTFWGSQEIIRDSVSHYSWNPHTKLTMIGAGGAFFQTMVDAFIEYYKTKQIAKINVDKIQMYRGFLPTFYRNAGFAIILQNSIFTMRNYFGVKNEYFNNLLLPGISGAIASVTTQWLDRTKTMVQSHNGMTLTKALGTLRWHNFMEGAIPRATLGFFNMGIGYGVFVWLCRG